MFKDKELIADADEGRLEIDPLISQQRRIAELVNEFSVCPTT